MNTDQRSTFVTTVAWIFIIFTGLATLISVLQNIMLHVFFAIPEMSMVMNMPLSGEPAFVTFLKSQMRLFAALLLVYTAITFASSIGLLLRKNWARLIFIGMLVLNVAWCIAGIILQFAMLPSMQDSFASVPNGPDMTIPLITVSIFSVLVVLGFAALYAWIANRLVSPAIVAEFRR